MLPKLISQLMGYSPCVQYFLIYLIPLSFFIHIQENSNGSSTPLSIIFVLRVMSSNLFLTENLTLNLMSWQETISMKASTVKYVSCIVCTLVWYAKVGGGMMKKLLFLCIKYAPKKQRKKLLFLCVLNVCPPPQKKPRHFQSRFFSLIRDQFACVSW